MVLRLNTKVSRTAATKITRDLESKLKAAQSKILVKTALYMEQFIKEDPVVFVNAGKSILKEMQTIYYKGGGIGEEDIADFSHMDLIEAEIRKNVAETIKVIPQEKTVKWFATIVSDAFMGLDGAIDGDSSSPGRAGTLPWISFFIAGTIEERLLWINQETSSKLAEASSSWKANAPEEYGRFGNGFLIPERIIAGLLSSIGIDPSSLVHPISGQSGGDWFSNKTLTNMIQNDPLFHSKYVEPARARAINEILAEIRSQTPSK